MSPPGTIADMLATHPAPNSTRNEKLEQLLAALTECPATCTACADACLAEENVANFRACIRTNLDCADICAATARVAARQTGTTEQILLVLARACETACRACAAECDRHASMMEHCKICADACHRCEEVCLSFT